MKLRLFTLGATAITLHGGTLLFAAYMVIFGHGALLLVGMISILLHECAHGLAARMIGESPTELELTPLGALLRLEDEEAVPPLRRALMILAGPAATAGLCHLTILLTRQGLLSLDTGRMLFSCNMAILLVNLLPVLPLDGGRLLACVLDCFLQGHTVRAVFRVLGMVVGCGMVVLALLLVWLSGSFNLSLAFAGCFVCYSAHAAAITHALSQVRRFMNRKIRLERQGMQRCCVTAVMESTLLSTVMDRMPPYRYGVFMILESGTLHPLTTVTEDRLIEALLTTPKGSFALLKETKAELLPGRMSQSAD